MSTGAFQNSAPSSCQNKGQAALMLDCRLSVEASRAFLRHADDCQTCHSELLALEKLNALAAELPKLSLSPGEERRLEVKLLERARRSRTSAASRSGVWLPVIASLAALTLWLVFWQRGPLAPALPAVVIADAPSFEFLQPAGAVLSIAERGPTTRVRLESGHVELRVRKLHEGQRFLVDLPDGELEVKGTQFSVDAIHAQTERVCVTEGVVELRLRGQPSLLLRAGDSWSSVKPAASVEVGAAPSSLPAPSTPSALSAVVTAAEKPSAPASATPPEPKARSAPVASPGADFAAAMQLFTSGSYAKASEAFVGFAQTYPGDSRAEDALYLAAASRSRLGDKNGARELAQRYLNRHPKGFRRPEATLLAQSEF